jgi:hypothetical protein
MIKRMLRELSFFKILFISCMTFVSSNVMGQDGVIKGIVNDSLRKPIEACNVSIQGESNGTITDSRGRYELKITPYKELIIVYSFLGYASQKFTIKLTPGEIKELNVQLQSTVKMLGPVNVSGEKSRDLLMTPIQPKTLELMPSASGNFEGTLKTFPGVVSNNELSSTYSVRGGSFDENLVYVNDVEIYRPFLTRSGQQEGLSFINSDLIANINFSSGGFNATYSDKLSSVLDIEYRKPESFAGTAYVSFLGAGFHLEGISKNEKFTWLTGFRQKSNQFLLQNLDTRGEYRPTFTDLQSLFSYQFTERTSLSFLGNLSINDYRVIPTSRETEFGNINEALKFTVYFGGQEQNAYSTSQSALTLNHRVNDHLNLKFIGAGFITKEKENFDILGEYFIDELDKDLGSSNFGNVASNRGIGAFLDHARNELQASVTSFEHKGTYVQSKYNFKWGVKAQHEEIVDNLDEWQYRDSADFSIVHPPDNPGDSVDFTQQIVLNNVVKNKINLNSNRFSSFFNSTWQLDSSLTLLAGVRATYWDFSNELNISPRASVEYRPKGNKFLKLRAATGVYYQPPFYRELRGLDGKINTDVKAQRSIHFIVGGDYQFLSWGREFKLTAEAYYKKMSNLNPYKLENTRLRYLARNNADGYATGLDLRVNGEFVSGIESWASLSFLKTAEDLNDDGYFNYYNSEGDLIIPGYTFNNTPVDSQFVTPGNIPRPTDQRVTFSLFFQDYLPKSPSVRMHMTLIFGTGLPFGPPGNDRYKDILRAPTYRRVDIGFSKILIDEDKPNTSRLKVISKLKSLSLSLEVFNLLQVSNTISYTWITDVTGRQYGIPNYLTSRLLNLRLQAKF